jgi:hypothetical protein
VTCTSKFEVEFEVEDDEEGETKRPVVVDDG